MPDKNENTNQVTHAQSKNADSETISRVVRKEINPEKDEIKEN